MSKYQKSQSDWKSRNHIAVKKTRFIDAQLKSLHGTYKQICSDQNFFRKNFIKPSVSQSDRKFTFNEQRFNSLIEEYKIDPEKFTKNFITPCLDIVSTKQVVNHERSDVLIEKSKKNKLLLMENLSLLSYNFLLLSNYNVSFELFQETVYKLRDKSPLNYTIMSTKTVEEQFEINYRSLCAIEPILSLTSIKEISLRNFKLLYENFFVLHDAPAQQSSTSAINNNALSGRY